MKPSGVITLSTDFGTDGTFSACMKGVILEINPNANVVDSTHAIKPYDINAAAYSIATSYCYFPAGTIHVIVVDPGVGGARDAVAVEAGDYLFVAPNNGVLSEVISENTPYDAVRLDVPSFFRDPVSNTFHGRDVFAPVAAHLSNGIGLTELGSRILRLNRIDIAVPTVEENCIRGEVKYVDAFGNLITNITNEFLNELCRSTSLIEIRIKDHVIYQFSDYYEQGKPDALIALINSNGLLEIAFNRSSAAQVLGIAERCPIVVTLTTKRNEQR